MNQPALTTLTEAEFEDRYVVITKDGEYFEYDDVKDEPANHVWTIVEGDEEHKCHDGEYRSHLYALPGFHHVNRIGYIKTEQPWESEAIEAIYFNVLD